MIIGNISLRGETIGEVRQAITMVLTEWELSHKPALEKHRGTAVVAMTILGHPDKATDVAEKTSNPVHFGSASGTTCGLAYGVELPLGDVVITKEDEDIVVTCERCLEILTAP